MPEKEYWCIYMYEAGDLAGDASRDSFLFRMEIFFVSSRASSQPKRDGGFSRMDDRPFEVRQIRQIDDGQKKERVKKKIEERRHFCSKV